MGIRPTLSLSAKQATYVAEANSPCSQNPGPSQRRFVYRRQRACQVVEYGNPPNMNMLDYELP